MRRQVIYFLCVLILSTFYDESLGQTSIDFDNINRLLFYVPSDEYKNNNIETVKIFREIPSSERDLIEESHYDTNGFLTLKKNHDRIYLNDSDIIKINYDKHQGYIVCREINRISVLKAGDDPYLFWGSYFPLLIQHPEASVNETLKVKSIYKWTEDSSFLYQTFINENKIESGILTTVYSLNSPYDNQSAFLENIVDTVLLNDTLIINNWNRINDSSSISVKDFFYLGKLYKKEKNIYLRNEVWFSTFTTYNYDAEGRKTFEGYYDNRGVNTGEKIFRYETNSKKYTVFEKTFDRTRSKNQSTANYDTEGRVIEKTKTIWGEKLVFERVVYKYLENGLIKEEQFWRDDELVEKLFFEYKNHPTSLPSF